MLIRNSEEMKDLMARCYASTRTTAELLFADRITRKFRSVHDQLFDLMDDNTKQKVCIAAPRGFGKTTLNTIIQPAKKIMFQEKKFIVPVSATSASALMQGENLKQELLSNVQLNQLFGPMKSSVFSKEQWITQNGVMVMPRGAGQQVRGILYGRQRPDLIIVDDLENSENVESDEQRAKLKQWFFSDLCNCVDRSSKDWKIVVIGTVLHEDALLVNLLDDPEWESIRLEVCDDNFEACFPDFMTSKECRALYESYKKQGLADSFFREYRNIPISTLDASFKSEFFKYYEEPDIDFKNIRSAVIVDPAKTATMQSADSAVVCWGVDKESHKMYFRDSENGKWYPDQLYDKMFDMLRRTKSDILAVEVTSLNEFIVQPIKNEMAKRGVYPQFVELKARDKKEKRVGALAPFYRQGYIYHNKAISTVLESQLLTFPRSALWDVMDASAYIIELMELEGDYFHPSDFDPYDAEEEYKELDNDEANIGTNLC